MQLNCDDVGTDCPSRLYCESVWVMDTCVHDSFMVVSRRQETVTALLASWLYCESVCVALIWVHDILEGGDALGIGVTEGRDGVGGKVGGPMGT